MAVSTSKPVGLMHRLSEMRDSLPLKSRGLADYILHHPRQAVFLRVRGLAKECGVSVSTVMRFISRIGFEGYGQFIEALREHMDAELTLLDRVELAKVEGRERERFSRLVNEEVDNLKRLEQTLDLKSASQAVDRLIEAKAIYVIGSRISFAVAYFLGWSFMKLRPGVHLLKGNDSTTHDHLAAAPVGSEVVIAATSRYSNDLMIIARQAKSMGLGVIVLADGANCPLNRFADLVLPAPSRHFPVLGSLSALNCLVVYLGMEFLARAGKNSTSHQKKIEELYKDLNIFFNPDRGD